MSAPLYSVQIAGRTLSDKLPLAEALRIAQANTRAMVFNGDGRQVWPVRKPPQSFRESCFSARIA